MKSKIRTAVFGISDPWAQMQAEVDSILRSTIPTLDLDDAFKAKDSIIDAILAELKQSMAVHGYSVEKVLITDLKPDASVQAAMNQINIEKRNREAAKAKGEHLKILRIKKAEADADE